MQHIFHNPYACIKVIFLDRRHIKTLANYLKHDPQWQQLRRFVRHMPGHKNHLHVRVGDQDGKGAGTCKDAHPENETDTEGEDL